MVGNITKMEQCAKESAKKIVESGETHKPIMLVETLTGIVIAGIIGPKEEFGTGIPPMLRKMEAIGYVFVIESWVAVTPVGSNTTRRILGGEMKVHELPPDDRDEAIVIISVEKGKPSKTMMAIIDNTPNGRRLREFRDYPGLLRGRMVIEDW